MKATPTRGELKGLIDQYRTQCLWFAAEDYYPRTVAEAIQALERIQRYGDLNAFKKAGEFKRWLSQNSSAESVVS